MLVWSLESALEDPEFVFTSPSPVCSAMFSRYDSRIILGSTYSGQILMWDVRYGNVYGGMYMWICGYVDMWICGYVVIYVNVIDFVSFSCFLFLSFSVFLSLSFLFPLPFFLSRSFSLFTNIPHRAKSVPVMVSPLSSNAHTHPVYSMKVIGTQNAHNLGIIFRFLFDFFF